MSRTGRNKISSICPRLRAGMILLIMTGYVDAAPYFNPLFISGDAASVADLSRFAKGEGQAPGSYQVDVYLNDNFVDKQNIVFSAQMTKPAATAANAATGLGNGPVIARNVIEDDSGLTPCLSRGFLQKLNVNVSAFPALENIAENECVALSQAIPNAYSLFDFDQHRLYISIPQAALTNNARGYISPEHWDEGIPALLLNYSFTGSNSRNTRADDSYNNYFLNLNSGANLGAWRLRNNSTWNYTNGAGSGRHTQWNNISTYVQRSIIPLRSTLIAGDASTESTIFDTVGFRGVQIASEDTMLPDSQRGFAPSVRGVANSNAQVTIRQNGYVIYQTYVPPGAFDISDLYPTSTSGDLQVTVTESGGSTTQFTVPYSSVPLLQRDGRVRYSLTGGEYRSGVSQRSKPGFGQGTLQWGAGGGVTLYGGTQLSTNYRAFALGAGMNLGDWGAVSADVTQANSTLADDSHHQGQSLRFLYAKSLNEFGTNFQLLGYRYSTEGFYSLDDTTYKNMSGYQLADAPIDGSKPVLLDSWNLHYNKKGKVQVSINQMVEDFGSLFLTGTQQTYWNTSRSTDQLQAGYNASWNNISYSLSYFLTRNPWIDNTDKSIAFSISLPLGNWLTNGGSAADITRSSNTAYATYGITRDNDGKVTQRAGVSGTLLRDQNLGYNVMQGYGTKGEGNNGSLSLDWRNPYGQINGGYNYSRGYQQVNYGVRGGVVVHEHGVTLGQALGDTNVLVAAPGASGVSVQNATGVSTDWRGYAVVPYATTYRNNRISLDPTTLKDDAELEGSVVSVVPTRGALVKAQFGTKTGARAIVTLLKQDGKPVPFGAMVTTSDNISTATDAGIVGDNGQVYLAGLSASGNLKAVWGAGSSQQCVATWSLPESSERQAISYVQAGCR